MRVVFYNLKNHWKRFLGYFFLPLGSAWTVIEPTVYFNNDFIPKNCKFSLYILLLLIGLGYVIFELFSLHKAELNINNRKIIVRFGDLFECKNTYKVIPVSQFFYETEVFKYSLQDLLIEDIGKDVYLQLIDNELFKYAPTIENRNLNNLNLDKKYDLGTTIKIDSGKLKYILFALTKTETQPIPNDNCNVSLLWDALEKFWGNIPILVNGESISIPLIGNNVNGINLHPLKTLEINLLAILYALESRKLKLNDNQFIEIIIYENNTELIEKIDLKKVKEIWDNKF